MVDIEDSSPLRIAEQPLGPLMNFGAATFKEGLQRVVNNHVNFASRAFA